MKFKERRSNNCLRAARETWKPPDKNNSAENPLSKAQKKKGAEAVGVGKIKKNLKNTKQTGISFPNVCVLGCGKSRSDYLPANDFESAHLFQFLCCKSCRLSAALGMRPNLRQNQWSVQLRIWFNYLISSIQ